MEQYTILFLFCPEKPGPLGQDSLLSDMIFLTINTEFIR